VTLKIFWTKRAEKKFDRIPEYFAGEYGKRITGSFVKKVYDFKDILSEFPEIGNLENKEKGIPGFTLFKQIDIFYRITGNAIVILDLFDNGQNPE
jgi:plasmid stabilization system protein ParE